jgi:flagellar motor protein MotB
MHETPTRLPDGEAEAEEPLRALLLEARFAQAVNLARAGHYSEAENLLAGITQEESRAPMRLDLLARIRAQQGKLLEAEALWAQAAQVAPGNGSFQAGLERIARLQNRPLRIVRISSVVAVLVIVLAAVWLGWKVSRELDSVRSLVLEMRDKSPAGALSRAAGVPLQQEQIKIAGISLRTEHNMLLATFDAGLFPRGTLLTASAAGLLTEFGRKLEAQEGKVSVEITGCTDDSPMPAGGRYRDNSALGMARAVTVVEHLRKTTRLPERLLLVRAGSDAAAPYPNDSPANRARNRTVTIRIARVE